MADFVKNIAEYKNDVFFYPNSNFMVKNVPSFEKELIKDLDEIKPDLVFIKALSNDLDFEYLKTDFSYYQGIDPTNSVMNSLYPLTVTSFALIVLMRVFFIFVLFN